MKARFDQEKMGGRGWRMIVLLILRKWKKENEKTFREDIRDEDLIKE